MYINEFIAERKLEIENDTEATSTRGDLLTNLIAAAAEDEESVSINVPGKKTLSLSESELRG